MSPNKSLHHTYGLFGNKKINRFMIYKLIKIYKKYLTIQFINSTYNLFVSKLNFNNNIILSQLIFYLLNFLLI